MSKIAKVHLLKDASTTYCGHKLRLKYDHIATTFAHDMATCEACLAVVAKTVFQPAVIEFRDGIMYRKIIDI